MSDQTGRYFTRTGIPTKTVSRKATKERRLANPKTFVNPPRTIKEGLINRGPGMRAAASYVASKPKIVKAQGLLSKAGKWGKLGALALGGYAAYKAWSNE